MPMKADPRDVRKGAQGLVNAIDRMFWVLQNMPNTKSISDSLNRCKSEVREVLEESIGYTLKVRGDFKTIVVKIRQPQEAPEQAPLKIHQPSQEEYDQVPSKMVAHIATRIILSSNRPGSR